MPRKNVEIPKKSYLNVWTDLTAVGKTITTVVPAIAILSSIYIWLGLPVPASQYHVKEAIHPIKSAIRGSLVFEKKELNKIQNPGPEIQQRLEQIERHLDRLNNVEHKD